MTILRSFYSLRLDILTNSISHFKFHTFLVMSAELISGQMRNGLSVVTHMYISTMPESKPSFLLLIDVLNHK